MARQLVLLDTPADWRLDDSTRAKGRRGLATARAALATVRTQTRTPVGDFDTPPPAAA